MKSFSLFNENFLKGDYTQSILHVETDRKRRNYSISLVMDDPWYTKNCTQAALDKIFFHLFKQKFVKPEGTRHQIRTEQIHMIVSEINYRKHLASKRKKERLMVRFKAEVKLFLGEIEPHLHPNEFHCMVRALESMPKSLVKKVNDGKIRAIVPMIHFGGVEWIRKQLPKVVAKLEKLGYIQRGEDYDHGQAREWTFYVVPRSRDLSLPEIAKFPKSHRANEATKTIIKYLTNLFEEIQTLDFVGTALEEYRMWYRKYPPLWRTFGFPAL